MLKPGARLFLTSFLALYAELICIRWIPAYVRFISYFTNFILLASFLGLGTGILASRRASTAGKWSPASWVGLRLFPWLLLAVVGLVSLTKFELHIKSAGVLYYGASESGAAPPENWIVLPAAFLLVSVLFACLGKPLGQLLAEVTPPLRAYALDIGGSIAGIAAFFILSLTQQPPAVWFGGLLVIALILVGPGWLPRLAAAAPLAACLAVAYVLGSGFWWSPYYKVGVERVPDHPTGRVVTVNNIGHQLMMPYDQKEPFYYVPYDTFGAGAFQNAMIIGAGSGSDVAVALAYDVRHVDAVEIDPVITQFGRAYHPNQPFSNPRVSLHVDDGRAFLRKTTDKYDLIVFALPDSLTLTSQFASLRLESFLFTEQALRSARDRLTPSGMIVLYNFYRETWLLRKLAGMLETATGQPPYVVSYGGWGRAAVLMDGPRLRTAQASSPDLAAPYTERPPQHLELLDDPNAVALPVIGQGVMRLDTPIVTIGDGGRPADADPNATGTQAADAFVPSLATDDWPLTYLPRPGVPGVYLAGLGMVVLSAIALVAALGGRDAVKGFNAHMFFLGAAFMLLETRSLVSFALLFGSTWLVNSLVFFAILCSVLLAILVSARLSIEPSPALYAALFAALLAAYLIPADALLGIQAVWLRYTVASVLAFLPIFLANLVFAGAFKLTGRVADVAFASNLLGAMVGGMLEYAALAWGYRHLLLIALAFYAVSAALYHGPALLTPRLRRRLTPVAVRP
jgi:hypothetical protein